MRVLHVAKYYPPRPGGMESFVRDLAVDLAGRGVESLVLAHSHEPGPGRRESRDGVTVERVPCHGTLLYAPVSPSYPAYLHRVLRDFAPDLVHAHLPNVSAFSLLLPGSRPPLVLHWHADVVFPRNKPVHRLAYGPYALLERALLRRASRIVATSQDYLERSRPLSRFRDVCRVVPLGLDRTRLATNDPDRAAEARSRHLRPGDRFLVLSAGRFAHYKGFPLLAQAFAEVARRVPGARLVMVGDGEERAAAAAAARDAGSGDSVAFPGRMGDAELAALMQAADVFCLPSLERTEAFGMVLLEAMAAGCPLVTTAIPGSGVNHVNIQDLTGLTTPPGDAPALTEALVALLTDDSRRLAMAQAARQRFTEHFCIERVGGMMLDVYHEALRASLGEAT